MSTKKRKTVTSNKDRISRLRLMDDAFMTIVFDNSPAEVEYILSIILDRTDIKVISVTSQRDLPNIHGRSGRLDIQAVDGFGKLYDIEVQRRDTSDLPKRARYYSSLMDTHAIQSGASVNDLPETYVIFITEEDTFKDGAPLHKFDRYDTSTGIFLDDEEHIVFVNGQYDHDDPIGRLMNDFRVSDPDKMYSPLLAARARYYKEDKEENAIMSSVFDDVYEEGKVEGETKGKTLLNKLFSLMEKDDRISDYSRATKDEAYMEELLKEYGLA